MSQQAAASGPQAPASPIPSEEDRSKDKFFREIAVMSEAMIAAHGREFAMGALVLAARFIAENKAFTKPAAEPACGCGEHHHDHHHHEHQHHSKT